MIWFKRHRNLSALNPLDPLPILRSRDLISGLELSQRLKSIERMTGAGNDYFKKLYLPALHQFIESVQLIPASAAHHHAGPGGLVTHTLDVIDTALRIRKSYNLPQYSTPEIIYAQEHIWSYAVFAGALLHDIGKVICNIRIKLDTGHYWTPHGSSIHKSGAKFYHVEFMQSRYKLHTQLANTFFYLLPSAGRAWLTQYPDILGQLTAWLMGDHYESGSIGEIVQQADGKSVATNLKIGGDRTRFSGAPTVPMVDRLTTALRQLIEDGSLKINRPDGSAGWCDGQYTYLVCGTIADAVREHLHSAGATDIPGDNTRLFDTWQDHGYALSAPSGGAIWKITINNTLTLTVLKFETIRLFHPSRRPAPFDGALTVLVDLGADNSNASAQDLAGTPSKPQTPAPESCDNPPHLSEASNKSSHAEDHDLFGIKAPPTKVGHVGSSAKKQTDKAAPITPATDINEPSKPNTAPESFPLDDPDIAHYFLDWIRAGLRDGKIYTNRSNALIHIVNEGVLLVSPLAFKRFIRSYPHLLEFGKDENKATIYIQDKVKKTMSLAGFHRQTAKGLNIHTYQINGANKTATVRGWLLPVSTVYGELKPPGINSAMENISGFKH